MNKFSMKILLILGTLGMVQTALAADKKFPDLINITFYGFESIPHNVLERAINAVPPQETTWGCGLHQCGHAFECAYMAAKCQNQLAINYKIAGEYPLAIDVNARKLKYESILKMCGAILDEHGVFRSGAAPAELTNFINDRLPKDFAYKAVAQSTATLEMSQLLDEVKKGIAIKMPVLAYYTPNPSSSS
ncbi:MAG TPA: hypothetical protein VEL47_06645, partial [Myxococcota bacterium]|nr:hypothetical protein [Myxococcota bacterium]